MSIRRYMIVSRRGDDPKGKLKIPMGGLDEIRAAFTAAYPRLKWESERSARSPDDRNFSIQLGLEKDLTDYVDKGLRGWKKVSPTRFKAKPSGIVVEMGGDPDCVHSATIELGGRTDLTPLADLCKQRGWLLEDPDSPDDVDLDDLEGWLAEHYG